MMREKYEKCGYTLRCLIDNKQQALAVMSGSNGHSQGVAGQRNTATIKRIPSNKY